MGLETIGRAIGMFAVTNIDDILVLALFFGQAAGRRHAIIRVVAGQYLGFAAILALSIAGALGAGLLPESVIPYLGVLPIVLGIRAAWSAWSERRNGSSAEDEAAAQGTGGPGVLQVAAVTFANGGDNIGVYVPVFAVTSAGGLAVFTIVFLIGVGVWCLAGKYFAAHPVIATALARWGHVLLPIALIAIGLVILIEGGAFGL